MADLHILFKGAEIIVPTAVTYIADLLAKGGVGQIGKDIYESLYKKAVSKPEKAAIENFQKSPTDEKNKGKVELLLEEWLENDPQFKQELVDLLKEASDNNNSITNSKNIVQNSSLIVKEGNIQIGDNY